MNVLRVVSDIQCEAPGELARFSSDMFGLQVVMDQGWIVTLAGAAEQRPQITLARDGGSGTELPRLSIEVDDLDVALDRAREMGIEPEYGPVLEPWGVRRFFLRDPAGTLINVLTHAA